MKLLNDLSCLLLLLFEERSTDLLFTEGDRIDEDVKLERRVSL